MRSRITLLILFFSLSTWAITPMHTDTISDGEVKSAPEDLILVGGCSSWDCAAPCKKVYPVAKSALKSESLAKCMMKLFFKESTCNTHGPQPAGTAGNPHAGFGLCTIESSPALRKKRGANCRAASAKNIPAQVLCCRDMMKSTSKSGSYFGPVRRGEVPKCI